MDVVAQSYRGKGCKVILRTHHLRPRIKEACALALGEINEMQMKGAPCQLGMWFLEAACEVCASWVWVKVIDARLGRFI
jgi:hypothetical protein